MAVSVVKSEGRGTPSGGGDGLSEYEKLRMEKIKRNEERMKELGLFRSKDALAATAVSRKKQNKKKASKISPELPQRRSSRKRKTVVDYSNEQVIPMYEDDERKAEEDDDDSFSNNDDEDEDESQDPEDDYELSDDEHRKEDERAEWDSYVLARPKKRARPSGNKTTATTATTKKQKTPSKRKAVDTSFDCANPKGGLTLEYAKTGRSTCRKCKQKIDKGEPRVGMEAWIVGRNAITWQRPRCLLQNLCVVYEKSGGGRGRCKSTNRSFSKGQPKVGIRCHTATSYYHVDAVGSVLANVVALMGTDPNRKSDGFEVGIDDIDGNQKLSEEDRAAVAAVLETVFGNAAGGGGSGGGKEESPSPVPSAGRKRRDTEQDEDDGDSEIEEAGKPERPGVGTVSRTGGRVEWKFGGRNCYGTLIPNKETKTHCYARTHKGNTKTLAKGKDYWSVLAS